MKEYRQTIIDPRSFDDITEEHVQDGWEILTVLPMQYMNIKDGMAATVINIIFERRKG